MLDEAEEGAVERWYSKLQVESAVAVIDVRNGASISAGPRGTLEHWKEPPPKPESVRRIRAVGWY